MAFRYPDPNLYLVGFMATGKSTIGRHVAHALNRRFIDSDHEIEERDGRPIKQIFAEDGEAHFRLLEREFVHSGHPKNGCVVACGGGLILQEGLKEILRENGVIITLCASLDTVLQRASHSKNRPLLAGEDAVENARRLYLEREPHYLDAGISILTDGRNPSQITQHIINVYNRHLS